MSEIHLYLSLIPESLVASMLDPEAYGTYLAVGKVGRSRGPALFFEVDPGLKSDALPLHLINQRCVPHSDGSPRASVYLGIYRVLERLPISAIGKLHLVTSDGRTLALDRGPYSPVPERALHLYQEFCPVTPIVASSLEAPAFSKFITSPEQPVSVPRIVFSELILRELAHDPANGRIGDLPYTHLEHLRDCLVGLQKRPAKSNKIIHRSAPNVLFRTIRNGFFLGDQNDLHHYPMPSPEVLDRDHHDWWRSAQLPTP